MGIDPGTVKAGYALISWDDNSRKRKALDYGVIVCGARDSRPVRLGRLFKCVDSLIKRYSPEELALEESFYSKNQKAAFALEQARGVVMAASEINGIHVVEYSAREIKKAITGRGNASKESVAYMVSALLTLGGEELEPDASDALGAALTHLNRISR
ncbi:MAG: crossover junction endodeoxyribonuclease RuvC [Fibrobacterota bacterium]